LDFSYKQALTFLPHWARGVQVFANGSAQRLIGDETAAFAGFIPRSGSWGLSLTRPRWNVRVNWNFRGQARNAPLDRRKHRPRHLQLDAQPALHRSAGRIQFLPDIFTLRQSAEFPRHARGHRHLRPAHAVRRPFSPAHRLRLALDHRREGFVLTPRFVGHHLPFLASSAVCCANPNPLT
jgi:hypothetical protein